MNNDESDQFDQPDISPTSIIKYQQNQIDRIHEALEAYTVYQGAELGDKISNIPADVVLNAINTKAVREKPEIHDRTIQLYTMQVLASINESDNRFIWLGVGFIILTFIVTILAAIFGGTNAGGQQQTGQTKGCSATNFLSCEKY